MSVRISVEVAEPVLDDIDRAVAEGRFPNRDAAVKAALRALSDPELRERIVHRERPPTLNELRARRAEILANADRWGATNIRVFGSVARGDATHGSDLDLLIDLDSGRGLLDLGCFLMDLQDLLGVVVDVGTDVRPRMRERGLAGALPL